MVADTDGYGRIRTDTDGLEGGGAMRKKELLEFGQAWVALIALAVVTLTVAIAATYGLNLLGV